MRLHQKWTVPFQQNLKHLPVAFSIVDEFRQLLAYVVGHAAAVGVAAGKRIDMAGAGILVHATGAVNVGEEPFDALLAGCSFLVDVAEIWTWRIAPNAEAAEHVYSQGDSAAVTERVRKFTLFSC